MISSLSSLLGSFSASLGSKVLASLGMGFVSFAGYAVVANQLVSMYQSEFNNIAGDTLAYISLAGIPTGIGIVLGAIITRMSLTQMAKLGKLI